MTVTLTVCTTCRAGEPVAEGAPCAGARLYAALEDAGADAFAAAGAEDRPSAPLRLRPVVCLAACGQGCAVVLSGPGRWTYIYGGLDESHAGDILDGLRAYAATPDGIVPWRARPEIFRKRTLARIPHPES